MTWVKSQIHIEVRAEITERLSREPGLNVASPEFLRWGHGRFYSQLPERLRWVLRDDGERAYVEAGLFRTRFVMFPDLYPAGGHSGQTGAAERVMREDSEALRKLSK